MPQSRARFRLARLSVVVLLMLLLVTLWLVRVGENRVASAPMVPSEVSQNLKEPQSPRAAGNLAVPLELVNGRQAAAGQVLV
ncbi:MAG TPA: hypothetical protein VFP47_00020, partial [Pyrinomonadaceae bacterium]|nr:hypothetical protein [Pyrinomonadaceae bacterium]